MGLFWEGLFVTMVGGYAFEKYLVTSFPVMIAGSIIMGFTVAGICIKLENILFVPNIDDAD